MRKRVIFAVLFFCAISSVFTQENTPPISQIPQNNVDPFKIEHGRSFSASVPRNTSKTSPPTSDESKRALVMQDFSEAITIIRNNYVDGGKLDTNELTKSSLTSMLRTLDPHSNYYDMADYQELLSDQHSEYSGIGCSIANYYSNGIVETYITSTHQGSSAFRAGLRFGDRIIAINGEKMANKSSAIVREKIRGAKGTNVQLTVERAATLKVETLKIQRSTVSQPSIQDAYLLHSGIGYIDLSKGFNYTTYDELNTALNDLHDQGMTSLILDLRDNPGGIVEQAVKVAGKFLPAGKNIVSQRSRLDGDNQVWRSSDKNPENIPLILLVNNNSASASEIVTGALQDYDRAIIVGEKTFGKGLVQSVIDLPFGAGLTLTTAKYFTPSGRSIQRDYSQMGTYDYFKHKVNFAEQTKGKSSKTITGRLVYGGDGITPDEEIKAPIVNQVETNLLDPIFLFAREIISGRIKGFENYKSNRPIQYNQRIKPTDFFINDALFNSFKTFISENKRLNLSNKQIEAERNFISTRLRFNLATAYFGNITAIQVLTENDLQVSKAIELLPRAENLFAISKKILQKTNRN